MTGTTTFSGLVLDEEDKPVTGALVTIGAVQVTTDDAGNFLLQNVPTGPQTVFVDGGPASTADVLYPVVPMSVTIVSGQDNHLPWPVYLHEMSQTYTPITPAQDTLVTDPKLPGLVVKIPAGTQIIGWDGRPNQQVSVTRVAADRNALAPIPDFGSGAVTSDLYLFNFGKPGGGNPTQPIPIILPNDVNALPGDRVELYYYDESLTPNPNSNTWKKFGEGTVSPDGKTIVPDPGVGIPKFCCGGAFTRLLQRVFEFVCDLFSCNTAGDPVILSTGQLSIEQTDLVLPGRLPVAIRRAYRSPQPSQDYRPAPNSGTFGRIRCSWTMTTCCSGSK